MWYNKYNTKEKGELIMTTKTNSVNKSYSNSASRSNNSSSSNRNSGNHSSTLSHSAVHKPVPGKGGKNK